LQLEIISVSTPIASRKIHQLILDATPIATRRKMQVATILAIRNYSVATSLEKRKKLQPNLQLKNNLNSNPACKHKNLSCNPTATRKYVS
jgi:hypothetical protein